LASVPAYGVAISAATPDAVAPASTAVLIAPSLVWLYASTRSWKMIERTDGSPPSSAWRLTSVNAPYINGLTVTAVVAMSVAPNAALPSPGWTIATPDVVTFGNTRGRASLIGTRW
jgi:hypothetical protein